jgi:hypothetical protein
VAAHDEAAGRRRYLTPVRNCKQQRAGKGKRGGRGRLVTSRGASRTSRRSRGLAVARVNGGGTATVRRTTSERGQGKPEGEGVNWGMYQDVDVETKLTETTVTVGPERRRWNKLESTANGDSSSLTCAWR